MKHGLFFPLFFLVALAPNVWGQTKTKVPNPVHWKVSAGKPDKNGIQKITVITSIDDGWYIYANPVGNEDLAGVETIIEVYQDRKKRKDTKITYPKGKVVNVFGFQYFIFRGNVVFQAEIPNGPGEQDAKEIWFHFHAVNDNGIMLLPKQIKMALP